MKLEWAGRQWHPQEFAACMAFDAFRIAFGATPRNFSVREVLAWLNTMSERLKDSTT